METITIPKAEYDQLKMLASKISLIEKVIHSPELNEKKKELAEARAAPREDYLDDEELGL